MNKDPYDLTPVPKKDIFTYTDMTEEDFENLVDNLFFEHAKKIDGPWAEEEVLDFDKIYYFARDLRAVLASANGPLQATTSKPLPVIPWSGSNLTEMKELVQKVQQLERENAALRSLLRNKLAALENQTQWECSCGGTDCEGQKENAALRKDKEILDWMNNNTHSVMFKYKPDGFTWDFREIIGDAMSKEAKP